MNGLKNLYLEKNGATACMHEKAGDGYFRGPRNLGRNMSKSPKSFSGTVVDIYKS